MSIGKIDLTNKHVARAALSHLNFLQQLDPCGKQGFASCLGNSATSVSTLNDGRICQQSNRKKRIHVIPCRILPSHWPAISNLAPVPKPCYISAFISDLFLNLSRMKLHDENQLHVANKTPTCNRTCAQLLQENFSSRVTFKFRAVTKHAPCHATLQLVACNG